MLEKVKVYNQWIVEVNGKCWNSLLEKEFFTLISFKFDTVTLLDCPDPIITSFN